MGSEGESLEQLSERERERIESFRRTGLRLDRQGRWWHQGALVEHRGLLRAINRWLDQLDDGRFILRLDERRYAYVDVEDAPYIARTLTRRADGRLWLHLSDGQREELDYGSVSVGADNALYCRVKGRRFVARFSHQAQQLLADSVEQRPDGSFVLRAADRSWPIAEGEPRRP